MAKGLFGGLKGVDAFGKTTEDVKVKTKTGAFLTLVSAAIILTFCMIEFIDYRRVTVDTSIVVDKSHGERLTVKMNVTFPKIPCYLLSLDVVDIGGEAQRDLSHNILKSRIGEHGEPIHNSFSAELRNELDVLNEQQKEGYCGSCYGGVPPVDGGCCQTCEDVRQAYQNRGWAFNDPNAIEQCTREGWSDKLKEQSNEGCNLSGRVRVNKVAGNLHLSFGRSFQTNFHNVHHLVPYLRDEENKHDWGHVIHDIDFEGDDEYDWTKAEKSKEMKKRLGIHANPLDGMSTWAVSGQYMFQYFLKVVSTRFKTLDGEIINTHQYSATHFERNLASGFQENTPEGVHLSHTTTGMPGMFINFDISPLLVVHTEVRQSFAHFLTSTCAIIGGVLTIATLLDSVLFATGRVLKKREAASHTNGYGGKAM
ncbi:endoplasmic reticulum-derived transport vesicle ERV46 [Rickenella mellea]|uniref:Endoplasmic reticulum-derived transport vesicle ERV46 n=1 Tax=Rickenella mellea TaxID=50990 RepID=A0A4Y7Q4S2_9AGAM|nr:endoplasmic reticulum-derived transport vesicle ERV46 [Rickenella mellea]